MRKILLASAGVVALGFGSQASAQGIDIAFAAALSLNVGNSSTVTTVQNGLSFNDSATMSSSASENRGVQQANQNAGAGSIQQNSAAVAALDGVRINTGNQTYETGFAIAGSANVGTMNGSSLTALSGVGSNAGMNDSVRGNLGVTQVNQNAGMASLMQNSAALASVFTCGANCADIDLSVAVAASGNSATGANLNLSGTNNSVASMSSSMRNNQGLTQVSQNAGAASMTQNSVALGSIMPSSSTSPFNFR